MTSFVSTNGPSVTVTFPPALLCTRTPVAPKCTPSVAISHPAFMPSSMSLPIVAISASVGGWFVGWCVKMLMKRMSVLLGSSCPATICRTAGRQIDRTRKVLGAYGAWERGRSGSSDRQRCQLQAFEQILVAAIAMQNGETRFNRKGIQEGIAPVAGSFELRERRIAISNPCIEQRQMEGWYEPAFLCAEQLTRNFFGRCFTARDRERMTPPRL